VDCKSVLKKKILLTFFGTFLSRVVSSFQNFN